MTKYFSFKTFENAIINLLENDSAIEIRKKCIKIIKLNLENISKVIDRLADPSVEV